MHRNYLLAVLWTLGILVACSLPGDELPTINLDLLEPDKIAHFILFFLLGWFWLEALPVTRKNKLIIGILGALYAILTEVYQSVLPLGRTADPMDSVANMIGLFTAIKSYPWIRARIRFLSPRKT